MKRLCSLFSILLLTLLLNGCGSSDDKTDATTGTGDDQTTTVPTTTSFSKHQTYTAVGLASEAGRGNGSLFRIPQKGTTFGKTIKIVFASGYTVVVPDTSKRYSIGNFIYRCGGGSYRNFETWTSHGGAFIVAPTGDQSKTVTVYY